VKRGTIFAMITITGWVSAHFICQWLFGAGDWATAIERSFFTATAQVALWAMLRGELKAGI
jgi:hypothetical protein